MAAGTVARQAGKNRRALQPVKAFLLALCLVAVDVRGQGISGSERVEFPSGSTRIFGYLFAPGTAGKHPAVVLVHGSGGVTDAREGFWARELVAMGVGALVIDSFTPRGVASTVEDQSLVTTAQMMEDAFAALSYLASRPAFDPARIAVMGFSKGGTVALLAADLRHQQGSGRAFAAHVPLYPSCTPQYRNPKPSAPILVLIGAEDNYTGVKPCAEYLERIRTAGGNVTLKTYPGAHHGFDGDTRFDRVFFIARAQNYRECVTYIEDDGRVVLANTGEILDARTGPELLRRHCMKTGASAGASYAAKMRALEDVQAFLKTALKL
jgi:dienelactone hydrolase